jgi:hypothetical protein
MSHGALLLETAWCVAVVLGGVLAVGLPVQWLLGGRRALEEVQWARAPLLGLAAIVLPLQAFAYNGVPVGRSAPWLWAGTALMWTWMWRRGAVTRRAVPGPLLAAALGVYLVHGLGLLLAGARLYVGRAWGDQFNYTVFAEFLRAQPFGLGFDQLGMRPYLVMPLFMKEHRLGQSVAQAFFATTALRDVKTLFEPTILLSPALAFLSLHELRRALCGAGARGWTLLGCAAAALLPGLAVLHLEGFLSQCLALPFLLLWPVLVRDVVLDPGWRSVATAGLALASVAAIYGEVLPILLGLAVAGLAAAAIGHPRRGRLLAAFLLLLLALAPFLPTPAFRGLLDTARYIGKSVLGHLYPWALHLEGLTRIWSGDLVEMAGPFGRAVLHAAAVALTVAGYMGLFRAPLAAVRGDDRSLGAPRAASAAVAATVALLVVLPWVVLAQPGEHPYQFYKLALTIAPVVALGVTLLPAGPVRVPATGILLALGLAGTLQLAWHAGRGTPGPRSMAEHLMGADARGLLDALGALRDRDLVLLNREPEGRPRGVVNAWLSYAARHNRVWLGNPILNQDVDLRNHPEARHILDLGRVPADAVFLTSRGDAWTDVPPGARELWSGPGHVLWQPAPGPWITLLAVQNPNGLEEVHGRRFFWLGGGDTRLFLLAGQAGVATLSGELWMGPGEETTRRVHVRTGEGQDRTLTLGQGPAAFEVKVRPGVQEVRLTPLDPGRPGSPSERRLLAVGVLGLEARWAPDPVQP